MQVVGAQVAPSARSSSLERPLIAALVIHASLRGHGIPQAARQDPGFVRLEAANELAVIGVLTVRVRRGVDQVVWVHVDDGMVVVDGLA